MNPFLDGYKAPEYAPPTTRSTVEEATVQVPKQDPRPSRRMPTWALWLLTVSISAVAAGTVGAGANWLWQRLLDRTEAVLIHEPLMPSGDFLPVKVERHPTLYGALRSNPREMASIIEAINRSGERRLDLPIDALSTDSVPVYTFRSRRGMETQFGQIAARGLGNLFLYSIHVPSHWSTSQLEAHRSNWAGWCHVQPEWIGLWSTFRPNRGQPAVDQCKPGGWCVIVSTGCNNQMLRDIPQRR
jgi:hypothetical protein